MSTTPWTIIHPRRPSGSGWRKGPPVPARYTLGYDAEAWIHPLHNLRVISAVEVVTPEPGGEALGPEYHVSVSKGGNPDGSPARCSSEEARWVLSEFALEDAEEDNHVPNGRVRNFWRAVADKFSGYECLCKDAEPAIREDKGDFVWRPTS